MKYFITGATGFVGSHLVEDLIKEGHEVYSLVRNSKKAALFSDLGKIIEGHLDHTNGPDWIEHLPDDLDIVIHTAGIVHSHNIDDFHNINDLATQKLFTGLKQKYDSLHFVFISSLASCGPSTKSTPVKESHEQIPVSEYGKSKQAAETYLQNEMPNSWDLTIIRPPMVIGPRDPAVLDIFKMVKGGKLVYPGLNGLRKQYSFVCVFDLVQVIKRASFTAKKQVNIYFAGYPDSITFNQLVDSIKEQMDKKRLICIGIPTPIIKLSGTLITLSSKFIPNNIRLTKDKVNELIPDAWTCDSSKSQKELEVDYKWSLKETVHITYKNYKESNWL